MAIREWVVPIFTCLLGAAAASAGAYYVNQTERIKNREEELCLEKQKQIQRKIGFFELVSVHLDGSFSAFKNQITARDRLYESLQRNHGPLPRLEYEPLFAKLHKDFNGEERAICELMRGITTGSMHMHNQSMVDLIVGNPEYKSEIPEFAQLRDHLDLWLDKYGARLKGRETRQDICLVYVGVAEKKPFPSNIGKKVSQVIERLKGQLRSCFAPHSEGS